MRAPSMTRTCALAGLAALWVANSVVGQDARATLDADRTELTVGDRLTATLTIEHPSDLSPRWTDPVDLSPFEILGFEPAPPRIDGDRAVSAATITLTVFELGELEIPSLDVTLVDATGSDVVVSTDPFVVGVVSVGLDEGGDIRDVKGPLGIALSLVTLWPWLLFLIALAALAYWWFRRRGDIDRPERVRVPDRPPHERAIDALNALERSNLLERGQVKDFHIAVSQIVREYVEGRFGIDALEMTSGELMDDLAPVLDDQGLASDTRRFLNECDLVKFAKARPDAATSLALIPVARRFVEETKPASLPEPSETGLGEEAA